MKLQDIMGALLAVAGAALIYVGRQKHGEVGESIGRFFSGSSSDETKLYLLGGTACLIVGLGALGVGRLSKGKKK